MRDVPDGWPVGGRASASVWDKVELRQQHSQGSCCASDSEYLWTSQEFLPWVGSGVPDDGCTGSCSSILPLGRWDSQLQEHSPSKAPPEELFATLLVGVKCTQSKAENSKIHPLGTPRHTTYKPLIFFNGRKPC